MASISIDGIYAAVYELYPHSSGWRRKVVKMPKYQVEAIFTTRILNKKQVNKSLEGMFKKSKVNDVWPDKPTQYYCPACNRQYTRDNPDLEVCEYCNTKIEEENKNND